MKRMLPTLLFAAAVPLAAVAGALDGEYRGRSDGERHLDLSEHDDGQVNVTMSLDVARADGIGRCRGEFVAHGLRDGRTITVEPATGKETCRIVIGVQAGQASVSEQGEGCAVLRDADCSFAGTLDRIRAR